MKCLLPFVLFAVLACSVYAQERDTSLQVGKVTQDCDYIRNATFRNNGTYPSTHEFSFTVHHCENYADPRASSIGDSSKKQSVKLFKDSTDRTDKIKDLIANSQAFRRMFPNDINVFVENTTTGANDLMDDIEIIPIKNPTTGTSTFTATVSIRTKLSAGNDYLIHVSFGTFKKRYLVHIRNAEEENEN